MRKFDFIVLGGGINGSCAALALVRRGLNVALIEQFTPGHERGSSHGQGRICRHLYRKHTYAQLMPSAYKAWAWLEEQSGKHLFQPSGIMNISAADDGSCDEIVDILDNMNIPCKKLNATEGRKLYPMDIKDDEGLVIEESAGVLFASTCVTTVRETFEKLGGTFISSTKIANISSGDEVTLTDINGSAFQCQKLIMTCGSWAKSLLATLGLDLPLLPIRVDVPYWKIKDAYKDAYNIERFPAGIYDKGPPQNTVKSEDSEQFHVYWTPEKEYPGLMKIAFHGSFGGEINPDCRDLDQAEGSKKVLKLVQTFVERYFPGLEYENGPAVLESCIYTSTPDDDFILDKHPSMPNIIIGAGFSGHGFKMAPETGEILADLATDKTPAYDMTPFKLGRFNAKI